MPAKLSELTLIFRRERVRFDGGDCCILECEEPAANCEPGQRRRFPDSVGGLNQLLDFAASGVIVKADCPEGELVGGLSYRFYGHWVEHDKYGKQFAAKTFVRCQPHGKAGVIRYLTTTCAGYGVGHATAAKLWEKFGGDAVRILREEPEVAAVAAGMPHFTEEKAVAASLILKEESALEAVHIDLIDLLGGRGFPHGTAKLAVAEWGNQAALLIKRNPYLLMRFPRCGYLRTDQLYLDNGGRPAALKRQALAAWYAIARDSEGHTWHRPDVCEAGIRARVSGAEIHLIPALKLAIRAKLLAIHRIEGEIAWLAESRKAENERTVAEHIREMLKAPCQWPEVVGLDISGHQAGELAKALRASIALFGGSPGTGKTYTAAWLIDRIIELCGSDSIAVACPTGKAAVRISEALERYGVRKTASTIHRLLGVASRTAGEGWGFIHDESNPLPFKYIVIDEGSMIDTDLFASLLRAMPAGAQLLIVGDIHQLPPISHGCPLRDMLAAGVPAGELREIHRNAGSIVRSCAAIRDGKPWKFDGELDLDAGHNMKLTVTRSNAESQEKIVESLKKLAGLGFDPVWDCQVLVSVNRKSELSRVEMNRRLQGELNPAGERVNGCPFRIGDKIIRIRRNTLMPCVEDCGPDDNREALDGKVLICNGEMGRVVGVESKRIFARFPAPQRFIVIPFGKAEENENGDDEEATATGCDFDLGYACTVHKFQGSESKIILYGLDDSGGAMRLGCRELFYTGISRGKLFDLVFGKEQTAKTMCLRRVINGRKTFLKELIQHS